MAGVKLVTEEVEKDVTLLQNVDAEFVSLVRHGANRMPFRVVKTEGKGGETMGLCIQSVMLPHGQKLESLMDRQELGFLAELSTDTKEKFDEYDKFVQLSSDKFVPESFQMVRLGDGAFLVAGELVEKSEPGAITLSDEVMKGAAEVVMSTPMDAVLGDAKAAEQAAMAVSFRELMDRELNSMLDIVFGTLRQSATDPKRRKKSVLEAVDSFRNFLSIGLDAIGSAAAKFDKAMVAKSDGTEGGVNMSDLFETKEQFTEAVADIVGTVLKAREEEAKADAEARAEAELEAEKQRKLDEAKKTLDAAEKGETQAAFDGKLDAITESLSGLQKTVDDVVKKQEELGGQPATDSGATEDEETPLAKKADEEKSVFSGLLTGAK